VGQSTLGTDEPVARREEDRQLALGRDGRQVGVREAQGRDSVPSIRVDKTSIGRPRAAP